MIKPKVKCNLISEGILTFVSLPTKCAFYSKKLIQIFCSCQPSLWMTPKPDIKASPIIYANPCTGLTSGIFLCSRRGIISRIAVGILICFVLCIKALHKSLSCWQHVAIWMASFWPYFSLSEIHLNSISILEEFYRRLHKSLFVGNMLSSRWPFIDLTFSLSEFRIPYFVI